VGCAFSLYLTNVAITTIHATCPWCLASAAIMTGLFLMNVCHLIFGEVIVPPGRVSLVVLSFVCVASLAVMGTTMAAAKTAPPVAPGSLAGLTVERAAARGNSVGPVGAAITVVEFSDLLCPVCRSIHSSCADYCARFPRSVRWIFRHRPLVEKRGHELSFKAAVLSEIAAESGKFGEYQQAMYRDTGEPDLARFEGLLEKLGVDGATIRRRVADANDPAAGRVAEDLAFAKGLHIDSTPTFIVFVKGYKPVAVQADKIAQILDSPGARAVLEASELATKR
jgi:protein-disulfide isomerase